MRFAFLPALVAFAPLAAQTQQLYESPAASVSQNLGLTKIEINYHRPAVKGREIWGALVPFGEVWRAGANEATTFTVSTPVKLGGKELAAGSYALFIRPSKTGWTLLLNRKAQQWGAYNHKEGDDALSLELKPEAAPSQEWLSYSIDLKDRRTAMVSLHWEKLRASFPVEADVDGIYQAYLAEELKKADASTEPKRWSTYFQVAKYWINRKEKLNEAEALLAKAGSITESFWIYEWKGRLLQLQGKLPEAIQSVEKAKALAPAAGAPKEYVAGLDTLIAGWKAKP
jgi:tetratricopeptide (TPR) repeat protein